MYGLTFKDRDLLLKSQNNKCPICNSKASDVDHDHKTGKVRGILCHNCNVGLGHFKDSPALLSRAVEYLEKSDGFSLPTEAVHSQHRIKRKDARKRKNNRKRKVARIAKARGSRVTKPVKRKRGAADVSSKASNNNVARRSCK